MRPTGIFPSWTDCLCVFRLPLLIAWWSHEPHWWFLPSYTDWWSVVRYALHVGFLVTQDKGIFPFYYWLLVSSKIAIKRKLGSKLNIFIFPSFKNYLILCSLRMIIFHLLTTVHNDNSKIHYHIEELDNKLAFGSSDKVTLLT